eukprot:scaffold181418_cov32-Tisochrysis_lutea.AAC.4
MVESTPAVCHPIDLATLHFNCARAAIKQGRHCLALEQVREAPLALLLASYATPIQTPLIFGDALATHHVRLLAALTQFVPGGMRA